MRRGDVVWLEPDPVRGSEQGGRRPAVVLTRDAINGSSPVVIVAPLTTHRSQRLYPSDVVVRAPEAGLKNDSIVLALHLRAVDRMRLGPRLGSVEPSTLRAIETAIVQVLDIQG